MNETSPSPIDVARRVLAELAEMAEHASLTRGLGGGERAAALAFNSALETLRAGGRLPAGMFEPLDPSEAEYGALAVQSRLLLAVVREEPEAKRKDKRPGGGLDSVVALAPFLDSDDLAQMLRERIEETAEVPDHLLTALAPFLDSTDLGDLVRRRMRPRAPQSPPAPPTPPKPPAPPAPDLTPAFRAEPPESLETLAERLGSPDITLEERKRIATRLAELAYEQASHG